MASSKIHLQGRTSNIQMRNRRARKGRDTVVTRHEFIILVLEFIIGYNSLQCRSQLKKTPSKPYSEPSILSKQPWITVSGLNLASSQEMASIKVLLQSQVISSVALAVYFTTSRLDLK